MNETGFKRRHAIWIAVGLLLLTFSALFIFISIPIFIIVLIDYKLSNRNKYKNKLENKEKEVPIDENLNIDVLRATVEKIEEINEYEKEYRKNVDLRQFRGRNNVTCEEVAKYLWIHYIWEGYREKEIICEEISKVSNIDENDIDWIMKDHYHHEYRKGKYGAGCWERNYQIKKEKEYEIKKAREFEEKARKFKEHCIKFQDETFKETDNIPELKIIHDTIRNNRIKKDKENEEVNENYLYNFNYEEWLKRKKYK